MKIRKSFNTIEKHLETDDILILTGPRQAGKTTMLEYLEGVLRAANKPVNYFTLEETDYREELNKDPQNIFKLFPGSRSDKSYFLIDEIQYLDDPTHFLKLLYDLHRKDLKLIVTGSSAFYMDHKFKDSLAGRKKIFPVFPLDFRDFLRFNDLEDLIRYLPGSLPDEPGDEIPLSVQKEIQTRYAEYLVFGGYPKVILTRDLAEKKGELREIALSYIKKDVLEAGIRNEDAYYKIVRMLADRPGALVNSHEIANSVRISQSAVENYLGVAQKAFHFALVRPFFTNIRKELTKMPKVYFYDNGLRNYFVRNFSPLTERSDRGEILENAVFRQLLETYDLDQLKHWRTADGHEVDFIVEDRFAVEVKYSERTYRENRYKKFREIYPQMPFYLVAIEDLDKGYPPWRM